MLPECRAPAADSAKRRPRPIRGFRVQAEEEEPVKSQRDPTNQPGNNRPCVFPILIREVNAMSNRLVTALVATFALAFSVPGAVSAAGVTTNNYRTTNNDPDIRLSCMELRVSSAGTLTGRCNPSSSDTTFDLTTQVGCHKSTHEPFWVANSTAGSNTWSYLASGQAKAVGTGSTGVSYYLRANCGSTDMELPLSRRLTNSDGSFAFSSTNLW